MSGREFADAMRMHGLNPPNYIEPGRFYRFPGGGKRDGNTAAWCKLFEDGRGGAFGDWSQDINELWQKRRSARMTSAERDEFRRQMAAAREYVVAEREAMRAEAAARAKRIWDSAEPAPEDHPYLVRKLIHSHGARIAGGRLVLPVGDLETGQMTSLQFIAADGSKMLLSGGRKAGCCIPVAWSEAPPSIIIAEGFATAATLAENEPDALVLAAIDAGNLEPVALAVRRRWPAIEIWIAGDDDRMTPGNPGRTKANAAALAAGALTFFPKWPPDSPLELTDFNDLVVWLNEDLE